MAKKPTASEKNSSKNDSKPAAPRRNGSVFPIVGVGASAGGLEAFTALLKALPQNSGMGFVFVLHQDPKYASNLAQILARSTKMPVDVIRSGMNVQRNKVYVAPADAEVTIDRGVLHLHERSKGPPVGIDRFLRSLADDQGTRAISVVLSGSASDGAMGTRSVKAEEGITFAQDESAKMDSMPRSAIASGCVDFVMGPDDIAKELVRISQHDYVINGGQARLPEQELMKLFTVLRSKHEIDFTHYKPSTIERRIRRRMALRRVEALQEYLRILKDDP